MSYFIRFTSASNEDLERGTSLLDLPSLDKPIKLNGLCGFSFASNEEFEFIMSEEDIIKRKNDFSASCWYNGSAVLFKGQYLSQNPNGEGVIFIPEEII